MTAAELWEAAKRCVTAEDCRKVRAAVRTSGLPPNQRAQIIEYLMDQTADISATMPEAERDRLMEAFSKN